MVEQSCGHLGREQPLDMGIAVFPIVSDHSHPFTTMSEAIRDSNPAFGMGSG